MSPASPPVSLAHFTTLRLGGPACEFLAAATEPALCDAITAADRDGTPVLVLGGGSNLVVADEGFDGRVVHVATRGVTAHTHAGRVTLEASAGEPWDALVALTVTRGWAGLECLSGIPGTVGATPIQNVGAYGQEVSETITRVRCLDRRSREVVTLDREACGFTYRSSVFKGPGRGRLVVLSVTFELRPGGSPAARYAELSRALEGEGAPSLQRVRDTVLALRKRKGMVLDPEDPDTVSAGSFFTNPVVSATVAAEVERRARALGALSEGERCPQWPAEGGRVKLAAAWLLERAGVSRGTRQGGAGVSTKHSLALVNRGGTTRELLALAVYARDAVWRAFGVELWPEPELVGVSWSPCGAG
ncbi:MAG: UDP-N-acetylmuramate dehydrogenase [Deltaproteobacteria bacterium]|nr:UDP-N-acetylmuramate dehydrogenase [Deltaproteobacteria bacterium]